MAVLAASPDIAVSTFAHHHYCHYCCVAFPQSASFPHDSICSYDHENYVDVVARVDHIYGFCRHAHDHDDGRIARIVHVYSSLLLVLVLLVLLLLLLVDTLLVGVLYDLFAQLSQSKCPRLACQCRIIRRCRRRKYRHHLLIKQLDLVGIQACECCSELRHRGTSDTAATTVVSDNVEHEDGRDISAWSSAHGIVGAPMRLGINLHHIRVEQGAIVVHIKQVIQWTECDIRLIVIIAIIILIVIIIIVVGGGCTQRCRLGGCAHHCRLRRLFVVVLVLALDKLNLWQSTLAPHFVQD
mmetsp:Transcript_21201/g.34057  ORF Transcript_21201/g.34057 Transcript_21201/m.34057 type:complete len:297 (+) Transcript_21201:216-1106(+)